VNKQVAVPLLSSHQLNIIAPVGLALVCPITTKVKGYPFEVPIPEGLAKSGVVLADQVKSFDWQARQAEFVCKAPVEVTGDVITLLRTLMPL